MKGLPEAIRVGGPTRTRRPVRVLYLVTEFRRWQWGRSWAYSAQLGFEEGLHASGVRYVTVATPWLPRLREVCAGQRFDQVWVELIHQEGLDETVMSWLTECAPIRVGFVPESLEYGDEVGEQWVTQRTRQPEFRRRFDVLTHAVVVDENDVAVVRARHDIPALWWPQAVPERFIRDDPPHVPLGPAVFAGAIYGLRERFLDDPAIRELITTLPSPETSTLYPRLFERLQAAGRVWAGRPLPWARLGLSVYLFLLRRLRRRVFAGWLDALGRGGIVVNLPHLVGTYPGRVVEAMAVSRPVVAWEIPARPRNRALFENGREIVTYRDAEELAEGIRRLRKDPANAREVARNAVRKVKRFHTVEQRVSDILTWLETGDAPSLG
jgi:hypothetical protein